MSGGLTTHVLDLSKGMPAKDLQIELWLIGDNDVRTLLKTKYTNDDGRMDNPLLSGEEMQTGEYELVF